MDSSLSGSDGELPCATTDAVLGAALDSRLSSSLSVPRIQYIVVSVPFPVWYSNGTCKSPERQPLCPRVGRQAGCLLLSWIRGGASTGNCEGLKRAAPSRCGAAESPGLPGRGSGSSAGREVEAWQQVKRSRWRLAEAVQALSAKVYKRQQLAVSRVRRHIAAVGIQCAWRRRRALRLSRVCACIEARECCRSAYTAAAARDATCSVAFGPPDLTDDNILDVELWKAQESAREQAAILQASDAMLRRLRLQACRCGAVRSTVAAGAIGGERRCNSCGMVPCGYCIKCSAKRCRFLQCMACGGRLLFSAVKQELDAPLYMRFVESCDPDC